jgi:hypothetical protein
MALHVEDLEDPCKYRQILKIPYDELITFVFDYIKRKSGLMVIFWSVCIIFLGIAFTVRLNISGYFPFRNIFFHTLLGLVVLPLLCVPVHELLHIIPYYLTGAKRIRVGMDLKQYMFYVTAHRHVATANQFRVVAVVPFLLVRSSFSFSYFSCLVCGNGAFPCCFLLMQQCVPVILQYLISTSLTEGKNSIPGMTSTKK